MQWLAPKTAGQAYIDLVGAPGMRYTHVYPGIWTNVAHAIQPKMFVISQNTWTPSDKHDAV
jgi:hypothetical protein